MSDYPTSTTAPIHTIGLREFCEVNGRRFTRRRGTQQWSEYQLPPANDQDSLSPSGIKPVYLSLVHEKQGPGEPFHWSLFVAPENEPGWVYQVKGDAECMSYEPSPELTDITLSECFSTLFQLAVFPTDGNDADDQLQKQQQQQQQVMLVKQIAEQEQPPQAPNRRSVTENCQGWTVRVIAKLVERGIVSAAKLEMAKSMLEPV